MMRLAIVATPDTLPDLRPAPGALDGDAVRARLPLPDIDFHLIDIDPRTDLAEQIEILFERGEIPPDASILFYASSSALLSVEGELFINLDPTHPDVGDSIRDVALVFAEHTHGPLAFFLECRHQHAPDDPFRSAAIVSAAKDAVKDADAGIELLVAARPLADETDELPSPLTRALIEALDDPEHEDGLSLERFFTEARDTDRLIGVVPCFAHMRGKQRLYLIPPKPGAEPPAEQPAPAQQPALAYDPGSSPQPSPLPTPPPPRRSSVPPRPITQRPAPPDAEHELPRVIISAQPRHTSSAPPPARSAPPPAPSTPPAAPSVPPPAPVNEHIATGDALLEQRDHEGALAAYRRALGELGMTQSLERANIYVRIGQVKQQQDKRREAISNYEKALQLLPTHRGALEALLELNVIERDHRAIHATEERLLALIDDDNERFRRLIAFAERWQNLATDAARARAAFEQARALRPDDLDVLDKLRWLYEAMGEPDLAFTTRRRIAELTEGRRARAEQYFELAKHSLTKLEREELALELFELALESDPSMLEPLGAIAQHFADRQEWSQLEQAYRRMLDRTPRIESAVMRTGARWELYRRLGYLFNDHLEDPALALDAFEAATAEKPKDPGGRRIAADLAKTLGQHERAVVHLQALATLEPARAETYHELFEAFQKLRRPDQAFTAASVAMHLGAADVRERFIFEEHRPSGVLSRLRALGEGAWELFCVDGRDLNLEAILSIIADAAIAARVALLAAEGRLATPDPELLQDPQQTTLSIVRSLLWASRILGVPAPALYLHEDANVGLAAIIAEHPATVIGGRVLRGRTLIELAFLAGRHLGYHLGAHRLLLYFPSIEELSACFLAAVKLVRPELGIPAALRTLAFDLSVQMGRRLDSEQRGALEEAVARLEASGNRADIAAWVGAVERAATRAGHVLAGDLNASAAILRGEPSGLLPAEDKIGDLLSFTVSDAHHRLRKALGIAIMP